MLQILELDLFPIYEQLQLEEALLRTTTENWCLINRGSKPAIVMGISQNPELVVDFEKLQSRPIPLIRRYSGGGTVVIEPTTLLVTLILNHDQISKPPFPKDILRWTTDLYEPAFSPIPFTLKENDYVIGEKKCGGNAQYLAHKRLVHHSSFVWDYTDTHMDLLKMPPKMPDYRDQRSHQAFLQPLKDHFASIDDFSEQIKRALAHRFLLAPSSLESAVHHLNRPHRKSTALISVV